MKSLRTLMGAVLSAAMLTSCTVTERPVDTIGQVSGAVVQRGHSTVVPGSTLLVVLEEVPRTHVPTKVVARQFIRLNEPLPASFNLRIDPAKIDPGRQYVVRAEVKDREGRLKLASTEVYRVLTQGSGTRVTVLVRAPISGPKPISERLHYRCSDLEFDIEPVGADVRVVLPDITAILSPTGAGRNARYSNGLVQLKRRGTKAWLDVEGAEYHDCRQTGEPRQRVPGVTVK